MSVILENKWDINHIQSLPVQIQQKVLRKILEKIFITKKCIQCKTSHALWIDVFELPDNKNIGKFFSKNEIFFLDHVHYSFDSSQILIIQYPIPRACLPSFKFQPGQLKLFFNTIFNMFFIGFSILPYPMQTRHNYWIYQTTCQAKPIKFFIKLYTNHNTY